MTDELSKTQRKRDAEQLQATGEVLLGLPESTLAQLPLPEALRDAVNVARRLTQRGALRRQRQYIGRLMRELDTTELEQAMAALEHRESNEKARFHAAEQWRERFLQEGVTALEAFFDQNPSADRQHMRHLVVAARKERDTDNPPRQQRALFREIRQVLDAGFEQEEDTGKMPG